MLIPRRKHIIVWRHMAKRLLSEITITALCGVMIFPVFQSTINVWAANEEITLRGWTGGITESPTGVYTMNAAAGNNQAVSSTSATSFTFEADISLKDGGFNVALLFGAASQSNFGKNWSAFGIDFNNITNSPGGKARLFCENGGMNIYANLDGTLRTKESVRFKLEINDQKVIKAYLDNKLMITNQFAAYTGGYVGFMTFKSKAVISNVKFVPGNPGAEKDSNFKTGLTGWQPTAGVWSVTDAGYYGNNPSGGDCFALSGYSADASSTFVYEGDMNLQSGMGAGLVFGIANPLSPKTLWYCANVDKNSGIAKLFKNTGGEVWRVTRALTTEEKAATSYHLRVEVLENGIMNYYLNGSLVGTYTNTEFTGGYFGVMTFNSASTFNNINYTPATTPRLDSLELVGTTLEEPYPFTNYSYSCMVGKDVESVKVKASAAAGRTIKVENQTLQNNVESTGIPVHTGYNDITVTVTDDTTGICSNTIISVCRELDPKTLYYEKYRPQMHFSPATNWLNDPNGLMYNEVTKEYHFFFQYNPYGFSWGNMSWGHAVSKDMLHWEEKPVALYTDELGAIFSGCGVIDRYNTTGFFDDSTPPGARMVAIYSYHGGDTTYGTQKQALAYSKDNGLTWTKYEGNPVLKNPGNMYGGGFRDPKVFWYEDASYANGGIWVMIVAGGRARLFTSPDLINWTHNSDLVYTDSTGTIQPLESECPDLFPLKVDGNGATKWVYTGSGKFYIVGDLIINNGKFEFKAETDKIDMVNSGSRLYATQSFFNDPKGRRLLVAWVRDLTTAQKLYPEGKHWNGMYSIPMEAGLLTTTDGPRLTTKLPEEVESLRMGDPIYTATNKVVTPTTTNILKDLQGDKYDIETVVSLGSAKEFGFNLRVGNGQSSTVKYNTETKLLTLDKKKSGTIYNEVEDMQLEPLPGNKIKLRILVDTTAIDIIGNDGLAGTTNVFFSESTSTGMEFYTVGDNVTIDSMSIYRMNSTWHDDSVPTDPISVSLETPETTVEVGQEFTVSSSVLPSYVTSAKVSWSVGDGTVLQIVSQSDTTVTLKALKAGSCSITATTEKGSLTDSVVIQVIPLSFHTNLTGWKGVTGAWNRTVDGYSVTKVANSDAYAMTAKTAKYFTYEGDVTITDGYSAGLIFGATNANNPSAGTWYAVNVDKLNGICRLFTVPKNTAVNTNVALTDEQKAKNTFHFKIVVEETGRMSYYLDGVLAVQKTVSDFQGGSLGLLTYNSSAVFNNVNLTSDESVKEVLTDMENVNITANTTGSTDALVARLPANVTVLLNNGMESQAPVTWNVSGVDMSKPGVYNVTGSIEGFNGTLQVTVTVNATPTDATTTTSKQENTTTTSSTAGTNSTGTTTTTKSSSPITGVKGIGALWIVLMTLVTILFAAGKRRVRPM